MPNEIECPNCDATYKKWKGVCHACGYVGEAEPPTPSELDNLLACPFCNSRAVFKERNHYWDARCTNGECYLAEGAEWCLTNRSEVTELWNKRTG